MCRDAAALHRPDSLDQDPFDLTCGGVAADLGLAGPITYDAGRIDLRIEHNPLLRAAHSLTVNVLPAPDTEVPARVYLL